MPSSVSELNAFGQPVGPLVAGWIAPEPPADAPMPGRFCSVRPLDPAADRDALFQAFAEDDGRMWTYLPFEAARDPDELERLLRYFQKEFQPFGIVETASGDLVGAASYMRRNAAAGSIEVGAVMFSPRLQRRPAATEAMFLMMKRAFEAGYRRYEWKCHALNAASRAAAERLGFTFEGVFRQDAIYKQRSRDTAWYSIIDSEWPAARDAFEAWLAPDNFDGDGRQRRALAELRRRAA
ncbi:GNAT family N-acetyltransferase [Caulobacter sp. CCUG 60055]|uniref:GNAT family N-acetyltransferase n=1 Tax=Caulobacter sp. CCUG 60055 TaxID=2100090 RepID=UPI001FA7BCCC|nr:GNAT family protein [Caulobacter sp. CCUG 60055]MCI3182075.1 GNAT family N-acetyltransferase [Caulobacter sp. CCUG 60055]